MSAAARLTVELERAALRAVRESFDHLNGTFFGWKLEPPVFELTDAGSRLGCYRRELRSIELSRSLLLEHGWGVLVEVLKHEMAHQYVAEVLGVSEETAHGPAFQRVCAERGFDSRASGIPRARDPQTEQVLDRIAKLLALSQSSNEHEAHAAMAAAQRLMLKYNLEVELRGARSAYTFRHLGQPSGRVNESQRTLAAILADHFFVQVIWVSVWRPLEAKSGRVIEVFGTLENVELAAYVHDFLQQTGERLWREHKRAHGIQRDGGRQSFLSGVMSGFREKLGVERRRNQQQGLVYRGDAELEQCFRRRHPRVHHVKYATRRVTEEFARGREAGKRIELHSAVGGEGSPRLRALPPRS